MDGEQDGVRTEQETWKAGMELGRKEEKESSVVWREGVKLGRKRKIGAGVEKGKKSAGVE
jgi:hypothetical protein